MKRAALLTIAIVLVFTASANAARDDDFEFAQGLVELKFYDLAKTEFEKIISDGGRSGDQRAAGELGLALLLKAQANDLRLDSKAESTAVIGLFDASEKAFDRFLTNYPTHPRRTDARFEVGLLLQAKGSYLMERMEKEPEQAAQLKSAAEDALDQAIDLFKGVAEALEQQVDDMTDAETGTQKGAMIAWNARRARFYEAVSHYNKGILYPVGDSSREGSLEQSVKLLLGFVWDNEDNILGAYAYLYLGLCKIELDAPDEALEFLQVACTGYPVPDPKKDPADYTNWTDLYLQGYFKLGEYCNKLGRRGDKDYRETALEVFAEMPKRIPGVLDRKFGQLALLQQARCLHGLKETSAALDLATRVSVRGEELAASTDWGAATAYMANQLINEIIGGEGAEDHTFPPDILIKAARAKKASQEWGQAVRSFQEVIRASKKPEDVAKYAIESWQEVGECYYRQEKFLEAYFAYDHVVTTYRALDESKAGDAAYYAYRSSTALFAATKDPADEALKKTARSRFAGEFPNHPRAIDLQYYEGADFIADADAEKDAKKQTDLFALALERLNGVKPTSILYAKAKARIGEIYYKQDKYKEAQELFDWVDDYIKNPKHVTTDAERSANRLQARALSVYFSTLCYAKQENWRKVIERIDGYETEFADENVKNFHSAVRFERVRALVETGDVEQAEKEAVVLRNDDPDGPRVPIAFYLVGMAWVKLSGKAQAEGDLVKFREYLTKAAVHISFYMTRKSNPTEDDWQTIGTWYYKLEDWARSEEYMEKALAILNAKVDAIQSDTDEKKALLKKIEGISVMLSEILLKQGDFAKARDVFEGLLVPDPAALPRVRQLLEMQEFTPATLKELMDKIRAVPSFMEGLARAYKELGSQPTMVRAITLLNVLSRADRSLQYSAKWWEWQLLIFETWLDFGIQFKDQIALLNVKNKYDQWDGLGLLDRSGYKTQFTQIKQLADAELRKFR